MPVLDAVLLYSYVRACWSPMNKHAASVPHPRWEGEGGDRSKTVWPTERSTISVPDVDLFILYRYFSAASACVSLVRADGVVQFSVYIKACTTK